MTTRTLIAAFRLPPQALHPGRQAAWLQAARPLKLACSTGPGSPPPLNVLTVLHKLLALAEGQDVLQYVPRVKLFKMDKPAFDFLAFEEAERMINAAEPERRTLILVALKTGLRLGKLIGLQWTDLDLQRGKLNVRRTIWRGHRWDDQAPAAAGAA